MSDTQRTRSALQVLFADNVTGGVSPQDLRDFLVTVMQPEFVNESDFWNEPLPDQVTTDRTTRGYHWYSQVLSEDVSMGAIVYLNSNNAWSKANGSVAAIDQRVLGVATESYLEDATNFKVLRRGIIYNSVAAEVNRLTGYIGHNLFLMSAVDGSMDVADNNSTSCVIGYVLPAGVGSVQCKGKWYFLGDAWSVI